MAPDMEAVSHMETEAVECRWLAAKFKQKAECARLSASRAFFSGLERRSPEWRSVAAGRGTG